MTRFDVYRATEWLHNVQEALPGQLEINWCHFSLHQVNYRGGDDWKVWEQPLKGQDWKKERYATSLQAFWGAEAARQQGEEALRRFHRALLRRVYQDALALADPATLLVAARDASLDLTKFQDTLDDPLCLERLAKDHTRAVGKGIFGTPTFVFPTAEPAYLKLKRVLTPEESLDFWEVFHSTVADRSYVLEIKRPH
jgi:hypothetical protein